MKIVTLSDTHGRHNEIHIDPCDILIHAGDFCSSGTENQVRGFVEWFVKQPATHKVFIAGNHDRILDRFLARNAQQLRMNELVNSFPNVHYLNDSGIEIEGIKFWGSPMSPSFGIGWAFNRDRGEMIKRHWDMIPYDTNILITHSPVYGILDEVEDVYFNQIVRRTSVGCEELKKRITNLPNLKLHISGHIHSGYGMKNIDGVTFINASNLNEQYEYANEPIVFNY